MESMARDLRHPYIPSTTVLGDTYQRRLDITLFCSGITTLHSFFFFFSPLFSHCIFWCVLISLAGPDVPGEGTHLYIASIIPWTAPECWSDRKLAWVTKIALPYNLPSLYPPFTLLQRLTIHVILTGLPSLSGVLQSISTVCCVSSGGTIYVEDYKWY